VQQNDEQDVLVIKDPVAAAATLAPVPVAEPKSEIWAKASFTRNPGQHLPQAL
jgi:hypothetical protein